MITSHRMVGIALGALLATPLISLIGSPLASADPVTAAAVGPGDLTYTFGPDTLTIDPATGGFDNFIQLSNFDFDVSMPVDGTFGAVATGTNTHQPFQVGVQDTDGVLSHEFTTNTALFINPDWGLGELPGTSTDVTSAADVGTGGDVVTLGPYSFDGYTDTFSYNDTTDAVNNYLTGTDHSLAFELDLYSGPPGSDSSEALLTVPSLFQVGADDVDGTITPIYSFDPAEFTPPDPCLGELGGAVSADAAGGLLGL
jgi:hypothetical protein